MTWNDVYKLFDDIVNEYFPDVEKIEAEVKKLCDEHPDDEAYQEAYERWVEWGLDEEYSSKNSITESSDLDIYNVHTLTISDLREGSLDNTDEENITKQEKTFSHIVRKLRVPESDVVVMVTDDGFYDYDPEYISASIMEAPDKYGSLCALGKVIFYKEEGTPFLFFKNEDDVEAYVKAFNEEFND